MTRKISVRLKDEIYEMLIDELALENSKRRSEGNKEITMSDLLNMLLEEALHNRSLKRKEKYEKEVLRQERKALEFVKGLNQLEMYSLLGGSGIYFEKKGEW